MHLFDAHCHLADARLESSRYAHLLAANEAGVSRLMVNGTGVADWPIVAELATHTGVSASFGVHPWRLAEQPATWQEQLLRHLQATPSAIGETGLDGLHLDASLEEQEAAFLFHWRLSVERSLPISVHCVKAFGRLVELLEQEGAHPVGFLMHGYGGSAEMVPRFARLGACFSFGGALTYDRKRLQQAALAVPADRLLVESDAPDQPPASHQHDMNEPAFLPETVATLANLRGLTPDALARLTLTNAERLFGRL